MQANDLFQYRNNIIDAFKDGTFLSKHLKKSDDAAYDYVLQDVNNSIQKIKSMSENIYPNLFNEFFELSPVDYAKELINIKNVDENKRLVAEVKDRISDLKDRIKKMSETGKKYKKADETLVIIKKNLDYDENTQKTFQLASKVDKGKSKPKTEESIAERTILRKGMAAESKKEEKKDNQ